MVRDLIVKILKIAARLVVLGLILVSVVPAAERPVTGLQHDLEHFLAFGFAGLIVALAYPQRLLLMASAAVAYTLALEIIQIPLATRHARIEDFAVDAVGACAAILLVYLVRVFSAKKAIGLTPATDAIVTKHREPCGDTALT
jgi:VanZ family protein